MDRAGRCGVDPRLPLPARAADGPRPAPRRADRVLPAHPLPADRAVHAAAVAHRGAARPARRRPRRVPGAGHGEELRGAHPPLRLAPHGGHARAQQRRETRPGRHLSGLDRRRLVRPHQCRPADDHGGR